MIPALYSSVCSIKGGCTPHTVERFLGTYVILIKFENLIVFHLMANAPQYSQMNDS